ncbi:MAG: DEAD/DEAH box helicase [Saprospiraceae bacterium]
MSEHPFSKSFSPFRRAQMPPRDTRAFKELFFYIQFDTFGAYLQVCDKKGQEVETSYLHYSGPVRSVLHALEQIRHKQDFIIEWEKSPGCVYLSEYPFLMDALRPCDNLRDADGEPIVFSPQEGRLVAQLQSGASGNTLEATIVLQLPGQVSDDFLLVTEQYALAGNTLVEIPPTGAPAHTLSNFNMQFDRKDLTLFLSLLYSNLEHIGLQFEEYREIDFSDEGIKANPCLIFEKIDESNALFLRVAQQLPDLATDALEQFNLFRYADINELEKRIRIRYVDHAPMESLSGHILSLLQKYSGKKGKGEIPAVEGNLIIVPESVAAPFIYQELPQLLTQYTVMGAEKLRAYKIRAIQPKLEVSLSHNIDFFEGSADFDFEGEKINLFDAIQQYHKNRYVLLSDGSHALLNESYVRRLERLFKKKGKTARVSFFDVPFLDEVIGEVAQEKTFQKSRALFEGFNQLDTSRAQLPALNAELRPYQVQGFKWLQYLHDNRIGGCLADDMGLGKTLQTLSLLASLYPQQSKPSLIVMPRSLLFNWEREVRRFAPQLKTYTFYGNNREIEDLRTAQLVFTTYATLRNTIEDLKEESFFYVILDESQNIKNLNAQTTKAVLLLRSEHRLALSGTPIENNLGELYSLFHFLNPALFGSQAQFADDFLNPIQKNNDKDATRHLRRKIYPFVLRRLKRDVLQELPDKVEQTLFVPMGEEQKRFYEQRRHYYATEIPKQISEKGITGSQFYVFQALNELRQIATIPEALTEGRIESGKRELLVEQLLDALANGHKALVFVNFLAAIESISARLDETGVGYVTMTGATRDREAIVDRFQNDPDCRVFLLTLKTGGSGLNLTAADTIFLYDPWWNAAAESQAIDRAHRMGQSNKVHAYKLIAEGSIEEKILQLQDLKKELFDNIISADGASLKSLSEDDIKMLLAK